MANYKIGLGSVETEVQPANTNLLYWGGTGEWTEADLFDETGVASAYDLVKLAGGFDTSQVSLSAGAVQGTGDAAWIEPWMNEKGERLGLGEANSLNFEFRDLTPGGFYQIEVYGLSSSGSGEIHSKVNGADQRFHATLNNLSTTNKHAVVEADGSGVISLTVWEEVDNATLCGIRISDASAPGPVVSLDSGNDVRSPGQTVSGTYQYFDGDPTAGQLSITDGTVTHATDDATPYLTNLAWGTDTVDGNGKHSGTWSVKLGDDPAQGSSAKGFLKDQNLTVNITDPGV